MSKRIAMTLPYFYPQYGGAENQARQLANQLAIAHGYEIDVLTLCLSGTVTDEQLERINVHRFGSVLSREDVLEGYAKIAAWIQGHHRTLIGVHQHLIYGMEPIAQLAIGDTCRKFGLWFIVKITSSDKVTMLAKKYPDGLHALNSTDAIIAINAGIAEELINIGVNKKKIIHIPNGVDTNLFFPSSDDAKLITRNRIGASIDEPVFLFLGRFVEKKAVDVLLHAWSQYETERKNGVLLLVGDDTADVAKKQPDNIPSGSRLRQLAAQLGLKRVKWMGACAGGKEAAQYYNVADALVLPSRNEGCPNVVLEAMASGTAIVGTRIHGVVDLVEHGVNGILTPVDSITQLKDAMLVIANDPKSAENMGKACANKIRESFSIASVAAQYSELYSRLKDQI